MTIGVWGGQVGWCVGGDFSHGRRGNGGGGKKGGDWSSTLKGDWRMSHVRSQQWMAALELVLW